MGTHPSCPSSLQSSDSSADSPKLSSLISSDPKSFLGSKVHDHFGPDLPFLFKVLAIEKALSIQAHPDKDLAKKLHGEKPDVYKG
jgi:mannose-6-phosphate isomerase